MWIYGDRWTKTPEREGTNNTTNIPPKMHRHEPWHITRSKNKLPVNLKR